MKKKLALLFFLVVLITSIFTGCNNKSNANNQKNSLDTNLNDTSESSINTVQDDPPLKTSSYGCGYALYDENGKKFATPFVHDVKKNAKFKFILEYSFDMDLKPEEALACTMTAYANYKQIDFFSGNETNKIKKLDFNVENNGKIKLPVTLTTDQLNGSNKIMIIIQCNQFPGKTIRGSTVYAFDLNVGNKTDYKITDKKSTFKSITYPMNLAGNIIINQNFKVENEKSNGIEGTKQTIMANKGQNFPLAFRVGNANADGILLFTINNNQYKIDGENYLYFGPSDKMMFKICTIKAPDKAGVYVLCAYYRNLPWEYNCNSFQGMAYSDVLKLIVK
jgi:hypothetical protein